MSGRRRPFSNAEDVAALRRLVEPFVPNCSITWHEVESDRRLILREIGTTCWNGAIVEPPRDHLA